MNGNLRVEIVTPVHNRKELTLQFLRSISRLDDAGMDIGVVIVDDGSTDGTSDAIRQRFPDVDVVQGTGDLWFTEGTNVAIRRALEKDPDYILACNDDQVFDAGSVRRMVETAEKHPRSIVGSLLLLWDTPHLLFQVSPQWNTLLGGWRHWYQQSVWTIPENPWKVDLIVGNCVLFPVDALRTSGLMRSDRYPNFGDAEITPRLKREGWELLIDPRARVFCQPNTPPRRIRKISMRQRLNDLFFDLGSVQNLRRRYYAYMDGAPSKLKGFVAYWIFIFRIFIGQNIESGKWISKQIEPPLSATFASAVVDD